MKKVTKEKISSEFLGRQGSSGKSSEMTDGELKAESIFDSVKVEAEKEIESIKEMNAQAEKNVGADFDPSLVQEKNFLDKEEQIA